MFVQITQPTSVHSISYRLLRFSIAACIFFLSGADLHFVLMHVKQLFTRSLDPSLVIQCYCQHRMKSIQDGI